MSSFNSYISSVCMVYPSLPWKTRTRVEMGKEESDINYIFEGCNLYLAHLLLSIIPHLLQLPTLPSLKEWSIKGQDPYVRLSLWFSHCPKAPLLDIILETKPSKHRSLGICIRHSPQKWPNHFHQFLGAMYRQWCSFLIILYSKIMP